MNEEFTFDVDLIAVAAADHIVSAQEAMGLEALNASDEWEVVPEWLHDAVERLYLYCVEPHGAMQ